MRALQMRMNASRGGWTTLRPKVELRKMCAKLKHKLLTQVALLVLEAAAIRDIVYKTSSDCGKEESEMHKLETT